MNNPQQQKNRFDELYATLLSDGTLLHVSKLLERAYRLWPKRIALICEDDTISYKELYDRSQMLASELRSLGITEHERVIIFYENSIEFFIAYFAVWQAGGVVTPLNIFLSDYELHKIVAEVEPRVIIISKHLEEKLTGYQGELPPLITTIDRTSRLAKSVIPVELRKLDNHSLAALLYTSGTTGFPKGVMLSSSNIIINAIQGSVVLDINSHERIFCALPLFHSYPQNVCAWSTLLVGATAIIVPKIERKTLIKGLSKKPTMIIAVPALYGLFCMLKSLNFGSVKYFVSGGDALSDKIRGLFGLLYRRKIINGYGLTETSPFIAGDADDYIQPTNTIGYPLVGIKASIRDENGRELTQGQIGTLWVSGPNIMLGYYKAPQATHEILKDGWLNTGDLAYLTQAGKLVLAGRSRDLISNKGLKIYPQEIENILLSHTSVTQAAVIGFKTGRDEEIPIAFVATKEFENPHFPQELRLLCQRNLAAYKIPRSFYLKKELPVTTTGKVDKKVLSAEFEKSTKQN